MQCHSPSGQKLQSWLMSLVPSCLSWSHYLRPSTQLMIFSCPSPSDSLFSPSRRLAVCSSSSILPSIPFNCHLSVHPSVRPSIGHIPSCSVPSNLIQSIPVYFSHLLSLVSSLSSLVSCLSSLVSSLASSFPIHLISLLASFFFFFLPHAHPRIPIACTIIPHLGALLFPSTSVGSSCISLGRPSHIISPPSVWLGASLPVLTVQPCL